MTDSPKYVYVVFSSTQYMIAKFIRAFTHHRYNHVSISLDGNMQQLYSFARRYEDTPFCGGFVVETPERYLRRNIAASVQICAIPVTDEMHATIRAHLQAYEAEAQDYVYNYIGALTFLFRRRVALERCHTCVDFATEVIGMTGAGIQPDRFYSIRGLARNLNRYKVYEGHFYAPLSLSDMPSEYFAKHSKRFRIKQTLQSLSVLTKRYYKSAYWKPRLK